MIVSMNAAGADHRSVSGQDSRLVARCAAGDRAAYGELMRRYREVAYRVAYAVMGDQDQAEDVVQEAFLRAYNALTTFDQRQSFVAWLKRITVNCALNALRKSQHQTGQAPADVSGGTWGGDPGQHAAASDLRAQVRKAVVALPSQQRLAITLFALEDMDLADTAAAMGCAVGTVKAHLHRGRQKLRQALADYLEED